MPHRYRQGTSCWPTQSRPTGRTADTCSRGATSCSVHVRASMTVAGRSCISDGDQPGPVELTSHRFAESYNAHRRRRVVGHVGVHPDPLRRPSGNVSVRTRGAEALSRGDAPPEHGEKHDPGQDRDRRAGDQGAPTLLHTRSPIYREPNGRTAHGRCRRNHAAIGKGAYRRQPRVLPVPRAGPHPTIQTTAIGREARDVQRRIPAPTDEYLVWRTFRRALSVWPAPVLLR
jgi:hypothetical protein